VLLALALIALAAVAVGETVRSSLDLLGRARSVAQPPVGWSIAREALLRAASGDEAEEGGRINPPAGGDVRWEAQVEETGLPDLFEVRLAVEAGDRETESVLYLYRPAWSNAVDRGPLFEDARKIIEDRLREVNR